ncbi:hypothetical protein NADFUDRAFT_83169 [Nadsonia fulvescens var. elongata DSM 6958]|uniref:Mediator of RNA polymerase II transcription subunit 13 n=1 Tax=Nadsonia fulvescens var. elongata DSM 6958 TaxID=857566 RepID=A0A1E3PI44_9ASCO|nr:hypothetical protein NADFUDRAFT_83169 [Nadsonia fulvescens var. elongata DSM 6958]
MYGTNVATPGSQGFNDQENMNNQELKEGDLSILDIMDETCGIILHHRIPIGKTRDRLSLITGYLLKPKSDGGSDEGTGNRTPLYGVNSSTDFLASIEISIVNSPIPSLFALKVLLKQYRNLASLGFVSGVTNKQNSLIPWHISACDKMLRVFTNVY